jgi:hypothetical protein
VRKLTMFAVTFACLFACLFAVTAVATASETPEPAVEQVTLDDLFAVETAAAPGCDQEPALAEGQEKLFMTSPNDCGSCSYVSQCVGVPRGNPCYLGSGRGWGSCNLYLGIQCSNGGGWDCTCYGPGGAIP